MKDGEILEYRYEGRAIRHYYSDNRTYNCLAAPCPNLTVWFYCPKHSHLCLDHMNEYESK